jgi:hypothetical protein
MRFELKARVGALADLRRRKEDRTATRVSEQQAEQQVDD